MDRALDTSTGLNVLAKDANRGAEYVCPNPKCGKKVTPRALNGYFYQRVSPYFAHAPNVADSDCQYYVENHYSGSTLLNYLQIRPVKLNSFSQINKNKIYVNYYLNVDEIFPKLILSINFNYCFGDFEGIIIVDTAQGEKEITNRINSSSNQTRKFEIPFEFNVRNIRFTGDVSSTVKSLTSIKSISESNLNIFDGITGRLINNEKIVIEKDYYVLIKESTLNSHQILKFCNAIQSKIAGFNLYIFKLHSNLSQIEKSLIEDLLGSEIVSYAPKIYLIDPMPIKIEEGGELIISHEVKDCSFQLRYCSIDDIEFQFEGTSLHEFEVMEDNRIDQQPIIRIDLIAESSLTLFWKSTKAPILRIRKESVLNYKETALEVNFNNRTFNLLDKLIYSFLKDGMELSIPNAHHFPQLKITHKNRKLDLNLNTKFTYNSGDVIDGGNFGFIGSQEDPVIKKSYRDNKSINILKWLNASAMVNSNNENIAHVQRKLFNKFGSNSPFSLHLSYLKNKDTYDL